MQSLCDESVPEILSLCRVCKETKPLSDFYSASKIVCKPCRKRLNSEARKSKYDLSLAQVKCSKCREIKDSSIHFSINKNTNKYHNRCNACRIGENKLFKEIAALTLSPLTISENQEEIKE